MAKGLRATTRKRNKRNLRAQIFGPAHDARIERLSAKLQEIAAKGKPGQEVIMQADQEENEKHADEDVARENQTEGTSESGNGLVWELTLCRNGHWCTGIEDEASTFYANQETSEPDWEKDCKQESQIIYCLCAKCTTEEATRIEKAEEVKRQGI